MSAGEGDAAPSLLPPSAPVRCWFCGEPEVIELAEMWGHQFMWETCCEALHESLCQQVADDPAWGRELLRRLGAEAFAGHRLRRVADDDGGGLVLDWQLRVRPVAFAAARAFVGRHHAHCGPPVTWRYGYAAFNGMTLLGVVMAGNPVARAFMGRGIVEVNRLCIRRDLPRALAWNCASLLYGAAAREAERRGFGRIITYTRADESGISLVAAGWEQEAVVRGRGWHSASRARSNSNAYIDKVRWSRTFKQRAPAPAARKQRGADAVPGLTLTPVVRDFGLGLSYDWPAYL